MSWAAGLFQQLQVLSLVTKLFWHNPTLRGKNSVNVPLTLCITEKQNTTRKNQVYGVGDVEQKVWVDGG